MKEELVQFVDPQKIDSQKRDISTSEIEQLDLINRKVAGASSFDSVMEFLFENTREVFPCDRIGISFIEDRGQRMVSRWVGARYSPVHLKKGYNEGLSGSTIERVLETGHSRIISNLEEYLQHKPRSSSSKLLVREGVRSSMTCPLMVDGRRVAVLYRSSVIPEVYDQREVFLHNMLAERLSQAVEKAYRIYQLEAANEAYLEMLGFASHELKSPLASIIMDSNLLLKGYVGSLEEKQEEYIHRIIAKSEALLGTVRDYLDLARLEGGNLKLRLKQGVALFEEVIKPVIETLKPFIEEKSCELKLPKDLESIVVDCDPELLKMVFVNLLGNAVKYGEEGAEIRLSTIKDDKSFRVSVWNSGVGFPKSELSRLFRRFSRLRVPEHSEIKGSGVGLYLAWQILQLHRGKIWADSDYGNWAEFTFEFPQPLDGDSLLF